MSALLDKIYARTLPDGDCLVWQGAKDSSGYSCIWDGKRVRGGHRLVYELAVGPIPAGLTIDHTCFVTACLNPKHLRPLTNSANAKRQKLALRTHCKSDHEFTPENTYPRPNGGRGCRKCIAAQQRRYQARKRGA